MYLNGRDTLRSPFESRSRSSPFPGSPPVVCNDSHNIRASGERPLTPSRDAGHAAEALLERERVGAGRGLDRWDTRLARRPVTRVPRCVLPWWMVTSDEDVMGDYGAATAEKARRQRQSSSRRRRRLRRERKPYTDDFLEAEQVSRASSEITSSSLLLTASYLRDLEDAKSWRRARHVGVT